MKSYIFLILAFQVWLASGGSPLQLKYNEESDPSQTTDFKKLFRVPDPRFRLPRSIIPTNYNLKIRPILDDLPLIGKQWSAPGTIVISVDCVEATTSITLHSGVDIIDTSIKVSLQSNGQEVPDPAFSKDPEKEFFIITFPTALVANEKYFISIDFVAEIFTGENQMSGLYRSHYDVPGTSETRYLATTQFQAFGARLAFPCFDEPEFKATFDTSIARLHPKYNAVCNTPINKTILDPDHVGWVWDIFEQTVPMPTYLVAMVISDYTAATADLAIYPKLVQTLGPKHFIDAGLGDWTAEIAARDLAHFEEYFVEEYSLEKMDSAAMVDFAAGAMENWGLNIYREAYLMYSKAENTENERRGMSSVLAHELAHQWFGNLITCKWWIDAWLNEGFASWIQYLGMRHTTPEFESMKVRLPEAFQSAMRADVREDSHPMRLPDKGSPYDTMVYLSALVYQKGSAVIRMMEQFLTERTLQVGLQKFLKKYSFQPVEQDELFEVLNEQAHADNQLPQGLTIKQIMDTWSLQRGYPLVRVAKAGSARIYISQEKFINKGQAMEDFKWHIPVAVATEDEPDFTNALPDFWIDDTTALSSMRHDTSKWILLNAGATGYYRVLYDGPLTNLILKQLDDNHLVINEGSRSQLIDDYFTSAFQGYTDIEQALSFTRYLGKELEYTVWIPTLIHYRTVYNLLSGAELERFENFLLPRIDEVLAVIGVEQAAADNGNVVLFRALLLDYACGLQNENCVDYAVRVWNAWKAAPAVNPVPIDLRPVLYCAAIRAGDQSDVDFARDRYNEEESIKQKQWLATAIACAAQENLLRPLLEQAIDESGGWSKTDATALIRGIAGNPIGRSLVMDFLDAKIDDILSYTGDGNLVSGIVSTLSTYYSSPGDIIRVQSFVDKNLDKLSPIMNSLKTSVANIEANIKWVDTFKIDIVRWLWFQGIADTKL